MLEQDQKDFRKMRKMVLKCFEKNGALISDTETFVLTPFFQFLLRFIFLDGPFPAAFSLF